MLYYYFKPTAMFDYISKIIISCPVKPFSRNSLSSQLTTDWLSMSFNLQPHLVLFLDWSFCTKDKKNPILPGIQFPRRHLSSWFGKSTPCDRGVEWTWSRCPETERRRPTPQISPKQAQRARTTHTTVPARTPLSSRIRYMSWEPTRRCFAAQQLAWAKTWGG